MGEVVRRWDISHRSSPTESIPEKLYFVKLQASKSQLIFHFQKEKQKALCFSQRAAGYPDSAKRTISLYRFQLMPTAIRLILLYVPIGVVVSLNILY
jgi:hypothetical protein